MDEKRSPDYRKFGTDNLYIRINEAQNKFETNYALLYGINHLH